MALSVRRIVLVCFCLSTRQEHHVSDLQHGAAGAVPLELAWLVQHHVEVVDRRALKALPRPRRVPLPLPLALLLLGLGRLRRRRRLVLVELDLLGDGRQPHRALRGRRELRSQLELVLRARLLLRPRSEQGTATSLGLRSALRLKDDLASAFLDRFRPELASSIQRHPLRATGSTRCVARVERAVAAVLGSRRHVATPPVAIYDSKYRVGT